MARCFLSELDEDGLADLTTGSARRVVDQLCADPDFADPAGALRTRLDAGPWDRAARLRLAAEYGRLFHGAGGRRAVPPDQSAFVGGASHGPAWRDTATLMAEAGYARPPAMVEPEDHIGLQLSLASDLYRAVAAALTAGDDPAADTAAARLDRLRTHHLMSWAPRFCTDVMTADQHGFYRTVAGLLARLLELEGRAPQG